MDDLYDNLENYHDEKIIDELKNENKELKMKLDEYSRTMSRLQKDFDKLNSEYKKLEMNYTSLLKTARAEIERKAEMIKSLNTEKDQLIIKTVQTCGKNMLNTRRYHYHNTHRSDPSHDSDARCVKPHSQPQAANQFEQNRHRNDRINSVSAQSEETTSSLENKPNLFENKVLKGNTLSGKTDKSKENITSDGYKDVAMKVQGEKTPNRRKSMPFCSNIEPIFSSDDDLESLNLKNIRKSPFREETRHYDKHRNRDDTWSKDKYYSNKGNKFTGQSKVTHGRYETSSKCNKYSPEKYHSKYTKGYSEAPKTRNEYKNSRQRVLRSPPTDKYNRSKSRDRRIFERENYYDKQRYSPCSDKSTVKHKIRNELEEPSCKRHRTDQVKNGSAEENLFIRDTEHNLRGSLTKQDLVEATSCQSPDYTNFDSTLQHVVREIKHTSATPLEDPRVLSKKYAMKNNTGKSMLSTVASKTVNIEPINVTSWNISNKNKFIIPPTVPTENLFEVSDNKFKNDMYMDIDKALLNDSLESGEIQDSKDDDICHTTINDIHKAQSSQTNSGTIKYKIPKIQKSDKKDSSKKHDRSGLLSYEDSYAGNYCYQNKEHEIEKPSNTCTTPQPSPNTENETIDEQCKKSDDVHTVEKQTISAETVAAVESTLADDLELSDETCESRDTQNDIKKSVTVLHKSKLFVDSGNLNKQKQKDLLLVTEENIKSEPKDKSKIPCSKKATKDSSRDHIKHRKTKKRTEVKGAGCTKETNKEIPTLTELKNKPVISVQTKHKFSDLFGDSSSLITPDDLGIPPLNAQHELTEKYASMYDNTQDAVDLRVEDINTPQPCEASSFPLAQDIQSNDKTLMKNPEQEAEFHNNGTENILNKKNITNVTENVKTVVLSTGVSGSNPSQNREQSDFGNTDKINIHKPNVATSVLKNMKALATSTPQKPEHKDNKAIHDDVSNNVNNTENITLSSNASNASNPNEVMNEADVPDIRLIVRRRRKIFKKPS